MTGVAAAAACPVVAVPPDWSATVSHGTVLVGVKSMTESPQLLRRAFETAAQRHSRLVLLHAWELPAEYDDLITARVDEVGWRERAQQTIARSIITFQDAYPEVKVDIRVVHGQAAHALRRASDGADVLLLRRDKPSRSATSGGRPGPCCATAAAPWRWSHRRTSRSRSWTWCWRATGSCRSDEAPTPAARMRRAPMLDIEPKVIVCVSPGEDFEAALEFAVAEATRRGCGVHLAWRYAPSGSARPTSRPPARGRECASTARTS